MHEGHRFPVELHWFISPLPCRCERRFVQTLAAGPEDPGISDRAGGSDAQFNEDHSFITGL